MDKEKQLLHIGTELFSEHGYRFVGIEDLVQQAGLSTGSFYTYFSSKKDFYVAILESIENQGKTEADKIVSHLSSPMNQLKALYHFIILGLKSSPILKGVMTGNKKYLFPGYHEWSKRNDSLENHIKAHLAEIIRRGSITRHFRTGIYHNPQILITALFEAVLLHMDDEKNSEALVSDILLLLQRGIRRKMRIRKRNEDREKRKKLPDYLQW
ncbi:MAG: TetR/AcrR family transcriptional regulator [Spirochaetales bacterium]|nr:TetR/AcrR family transcriptional regulator [Spirochaetales bacterium]